MTRASTQGPQIARRFGSSYPPDEMNEFSTLHLCHKKFLMSSYLGFIDEA
jgi:hypothetical protein